MTHSDRVWVFLFSSASSYRLLRYVAQSAANEAKPIALLYTGGDDRFYGEVLLDAKRWNARAFSIELELTSWKEDPRLLLPRQSILRRCRTFLMQQAMRFTDDPHQAAAFRSAYGKRQRLAFELLKQLCAGVVLCSEDGVSGDLPVLSAAERMKIPVVDIPYGNGTAHELEFDLSRKSSEGRLIVAKGLPRLILSLLGPQWLKKGNFKDALMFTPEMIFAWESLGMSLRDSWIIHGGKSNILCVENQMSYQQYVSENIPEKKLRHTGSPYCDIIFNALRRKSNLALWPQQLSKAAPGLTRVLVSWPPSYHETYPGTNEFDRYEEMTLAIISCISQLPAVELTVSLHPACDAATRTLIENSGVHITDEYLLDLIPQHDVFVTYFSSTIRWALAAGKVVLNYDAYQIGIKTFDSAPGFVNVRTFHDFSQKISALANSDEYYLELKKRQIDNAPAWGILDGQCTSRIFDEVGELLTTSRGMQVAYQSF